MLAIAGGKGGTGKTTTALALAREIARTAAPATAVAGPDRGRRRQRDRAPVVVVDADVDMPDVHAMTGVERTPTVLERPRGVPTPDLPGVRVAPAPPADATDSFVDVLRALAADDADPSGATADAASAPQPTGGVLVDAPCGAGPDAARPLALADGVVLVTRPTAAAVRDTAKTAAMARALDTPLLAAAVVGATPEDSVEAEDSIAAEDSVPAEDSIATEDSSTAEESPGAEVDATPRRSLADALDVPTVVPIPCVDGDPFASHAHRESVARLARTIGGRQTPF
ncbi:hypothetical protein G9C85_01470 [Halorubellus sp. JP-L1]|uniref:hypothetical protein n=1 Tax=Halorubellus sp. JP-L1 TaxID=2715753 RepID=UPI00140BC4EF|nr:hypothetical protein [Halorubellus sp. JP-L1]NHN40305.1 hypothetical protein [Halorubellus sp. JP-L1]